jgi:hypothetical protein
MDQLLRINEGRAVLAMRQQGAALIAGNADVPSALSAKREKPIIVCAMRIICIQRDADEPSAFPAFTGPVHP